MRWGLFEAQFGPEVAEETDIFAGEYGEKRQADLKLRVTEHNLLTVARYYTRITTTRLAELLDLTPDLVRACCCPFACRHRTRVHAWCYHGVYSCP